MPFLARIFVVFAVFGLSFASASPLEDDAQRSAWDARLAAAKAKQKQAKTERAAAERRFEAEQTACFKKFRVYDCQNESRLRHSQVLKKARLLDNEGGAEDRQVRKEILADKDAKRAAEAPQRAAELEKKEAMISAQRAKAQSEREQKLQSKGVHAKEGEAKRARDAERIAKKQQAHQRKVDKQMEKAARKEAEDAAAEAPAQAAQPVSVRKPEAKAGQ